MPNVGLVCGGRVELGWAPRNCCYDDVCFCCSHTEHGCLVVFTSCLQPKPKKWAKKFFVYSLVLWRVSSSWLIYISSARCGSSSTVGRLGNTFLQTKFQPILYCWFWVIEKPRNWHERGASLLFQMLFPILLHHYPYFIETFQIIQTHHGKVQSPNQCWSDTTF